MTTIELQVRNKMLRTAAAYLLRASKLSDQTGSLNSDKYKSAAMSLLREADYSEADLRINKEVDIASGAAL